MKYFYFLIFSLIFGGANSYAQNCLPDGITFSQQIEIDNFTSNYPNCIIIEGKVIIEGTSITNLAGLTLLEEVKSLEIINTKLDNLQGLENITKVTDRFKIENNNLLESISDFGNSSTEFPELLQLIIKNNPILSVCTSMPVCDFLARKDSIPNIVIDIRNNDNGCNGKDETFIECDECRCLPNGADFETQLDINNFLIQFPKCKEILGSLNLGGPGIRSLNGLKNLTIVRGSFNVTESYNSPSFIGLENLKEVGQFHIDENEYVKNFTGFSGLEKVGSDGFVILQTNLESFNGFDNLKIIDGDLIMDSRAKPKKVDGFPELQEITGDLCFYDLDRVEEISGFNKLKKVSGSFRSYSGSTTTKYSGFNSLVTVKEDLTFENVHSILITGFQKLDTISHTLLIKNIRNLELSGFNSLRHIGKSLQITSNNTLLEILGFQALESMGSGLILEDNPSLYSISGFSNLKQIGHSLSLVKCPLISDLSSFSNLTRLGGIEIEESTNLTSLSGLEYFDPTYLNSLKIINNDKLSFCNNNPICEYLRNNGQNTIMNNAPGCNTNVEIYDDCFPPSYELGFTTFYDANQDGTRQFNEPSLPGGAVKINNITIFSDQIHQFVEGNYTLQFIPTSNWNITTPSLLNIYLGPSNPSETVEFGVSLIDTKSEITTYLNGNERCNTFQKFNFSAKNTGTSLPSGTLWLKIDSSITNVRFVELPDHQILPNLYGWDFDSLFIGELFNRKIELEIAGPPEFTVGDSLRVHCFTTFEDNNGKDTSSVSKFERLIRCSYDPNDKLVFPDRINNYTLFNEDLTYTIRFQNTGNDEAYNVIIRDILDKNLAPESFKILNSSHYEFLRTTIENDRFLTFEFKDIFLPDSTTNFDASQGYVSYSIKPKENLAENTPINNTASIYFDFNPPIVTNTTENIMVSELPISSTQDTDNQLLIYVFPNPTTGNIFVKGNNLKNANITITDFTGRILKQEKLNERQEVSLPETAQGMFFLKVETEEGIAVKKVIKM